MIMHALVAELFRYRMSVLKMSSGFINELEIVFLKVLCVEDYVKAINLGPLKTKLVKKNAFFPMTFRKHFELTVKSSEARNLFEIFSQYRYAMYERHFSCLTYS